LAENSAQGIEERIDRGIREQAFGFWIGKDGGSGQMMGQQLTTWRSGSGQRAWLSMLIDTMEEISRPELRAVPCDCRVLTALRAQLARPASAPVPCATGYSLRN
jgi:hypothetical protein